MRHYTINKEDAKWNKKITNIHDISISNSPIPRRLHKPHHLYQKDEIVFHQESLAWKPSSYPPSFHLREREGPFTQEQAFFPKLSPSLYLRDLYHPGTPCTQLLITLSLSSYHSITFPTEPDSSSRVNIYYFHFLSLCILSSVWPLPQAPTETALAGDQWSLWLGQVDPFQT